MIHVAVIVASYGPFTLAMILGLVSLFLMIFTDKNNKAKINIPSYRIAAKRVPGLATIAPSTAEVWCADCLRGDFALGVAFGDDFDMIQAHNKRKIERSLYRNSGT